MTELRLHRDLYPERRPSIGAIGVYAPHATIERARRAARTGSSRSPARSPERERRVAGELANYALGLTAKERTR